jgi:hypothetical protein
MAETNASLKKELAYRMILTHFVKRKFEEIASIEELLQNL